jgi:peptidoglycan/xylan/chitin deacetylase (PgdA/CDA1 family)
MIGLVVPEAVKPVVREFFELFKTPWEFCRPGVSYDILISSGQSLLENDAQLTIIFGSEKHWFDSASRIQIGARLQSTTLVYHKDRIPIFLACQTFLSSGDAVLRTESGAITGLRIPSASGVSLRIGYEFFAEIEALLTHGQPKTEAQIPTLELHIALLRDLIVSHGGSLYEIPPIPAGYRFIACLTHDVDHFGIRRHGCDHTIIGFLYRAFVGSLLDVVRGRKSLPQLLSNWKAALSLPLVYTGLARDFWETFERYRELESDRHSTFFLIPKKGEAGRAMGGRNSWRAARYDVSDLPDEIRALVDAGCEVAVHGIDAWYDAAKGREELGTIKATNEPETGIRMHWLYFDEDSPAVLEEAGFTYDSTSGYNETVGYRAGTTQVFRPLNVERLLELPMHVMDTALFYPASMNLGANAAGAALDQMIARVGRFGGVLTINWHDRSIAPERLWDQPYIELLEKLSQEGAWFATAAQAVGWFRKRRASSFGKDTTMRGIESNQSPDGLPGMKIWLHEGRGAYPTGESDSARLHDAVAVG